MHESEGFSFFLFLNDRTLLALGMKTVRIFSDRIRNRIRLEGLRSVRIRVRISNIDTVSVSEYSNRIFMMSISNRILSDIVDTIRIRIRIRTEI